MGMLERQRGLSMLGFLFVAAVVIVVAMVGFRMVPAYIEYYSVQKALEGAMADTNDLNLTSVRRAVELLRAKGGMHDIAAYRDFVLKVVHGVSSAAREGDVLGIGGEVVGDAERAVIQAIEGALASA